MLSMVFASCDTIEGPYEETPDIEVDADTIPQVILFEFTGWDCRNCPAGHEMIHELEGIYGEAVQAFGIHAGSFTALGNDNYFDFTCEISEALLERFGNPSSKPNAAVNSMNFSDLSESTDQWSTNFSIAYALAKNDPEVYLSYEFYADGTTLHASVNGEFVKNLEGAYNLSVFVVENGIEDVQNYYGVYDYEYLHNHVLRASMYNGIVGESVGQAPESGTLFDKTYTLNIDSEWLADSLHVVPFVYNTETNKVLPTVIIKTKTE